MHFSFMRCIYSPLLRRTHSSFMRRTGSLFMRCAHSLFTRRFHLSSMRYTHSSLMCRPHSAITRRTHSSIMRRTHSLSCVVLILRSYVTLIPCSCFSHAAWSLFDLLFSLKYIKSQTSQPEYSATVRTSMRADVQSGTGSHRPYPVIHQKWYFSKNHSATHNPFQF